MNRFATIAAAAAALCIGASVCAATEIISVDVQRVLEESAPGKAAAEHVKQAQEILQNSMNEVIKLNEGKDTPEARNAVNQGRQVLQRQLDIERQAAANAVTAEMNKVVQAWIDKNTKGKKERFVVMPKANFIAVSANVDITNQIIKDMANVTVTFAPLPKVTVTPAKQDAAAPAQAPAAETK